MPIYERTPVTAIAPHAAETPFGTVRAEVVVRATEAFTPELPGHERDLVPIYSLMIATEPLSEETWEALGWKGHEVFGDLRHLIFYACRTDDGRIAIGGRGAPYHYESRLSEEFTLNPRVQDHLRELTRELFPQIGPFRVSHRWGGAIAASRDWYSSVGLERATGNAWAGAYVGDGVSTTNLAGRTLCDLIRGEDTPLTAAALGEPPLEGLGARAAALDRRQPRPAHDGERRPGRGGQGAPGAARRPDREDDRRLTCAIDAAMTRRQTRTPETRASRAGLAVLAA